MICLSKKLADEYVNMFANGAGLQLEDTDYDYKNNDILIQGMLKKRIMQNCKDSNTNFYYMDSGYIGNYKCSVNPAGFKHFHRIVKNNLQHTDIIDRPDDRWRKLRHKLHPLRKSGEHVLLVTPSKKPCKFYNLELKEWIEQTVAQLKQFTDRPIKIRHKHGRGSRVARSIYEDLSGAHACVTLQSIAAVESVMFGVPAFALAPCAADPVCDKDLSLIESPTVQDADKIYKWACHLAYGQYHINEMADGTAYKLLKEHWG